MMAIHVYMCAQYLLENMRSGHAQRTRIHIRANIAHHIHGALFLLAVLYLIIIIMHSYAYIYV